MLLYYTYYSTVLHNKYYSHSHILTISYVYVCAYTLIQDHYPEIGYFRDLVFMFKLVMVPTSDKLPELRPWEPEEVGQSYDHPYIVCITLCVYCILPTILLCMRIMYMLYRLVLSGSLMRKRIVTMSKVSI